MGRGCRKGSDVLLAWGRYYQVAAAVAVGTAAWMPWEAVGEGLWMMKLKFHLLVVWCQRREELAVPVALKEERESLIQ